MSFTRNASIAFLLAVLLARPALADSAAAAAAEGLFREGRELMEKGELDKACAKLAESQRLDPSSGTLLNLATCHEKQNKLASAWSEFLSSASLARSQNRPERVAEAQRRAADLEPKVSYLTVVLAEKVPGTTVKIDDVELEASALGSRIPVDSGERVVVVSAPGRQSATMKITIGAEHDSQTLNVPKLAPSAKAPAPAPQKTQKHAPKAALEPSSGSPTLGYVVGGVGIVALGVGATFGILARSSYRDAEAACPSHVDCSPHAMDLRDQAGTRARVADVGIGIGLVGVAVGVVLIVTHSGSPQTGRRGAASYGVTF
jgi:tetratricopeptide (TPR) repeat protein